MPSRDSKMACGGEMLREGRPAVSHELIKWEHAHSHLEGPVKSHDGHANAATFIVKEFEDW
jgi:hypothetical protein